MIIIVFRLYSFSQDTEPKIYIKKNSIKCFVVSYICLDHFLLTTTKLVSVQKFFEMPSGLKCLKLLYL